MTAATRKRLTVCADDFAYRPAISQTIVDLAMEGKVNAISCMAVSPHWPRCAERLEVLPPQIQVGLHLVLTDARPLTCMPDLAPGGRLPAIRFYERIAARGSLPLGEIDCELSEQFARFIAHRGRPPDFVDGHQHVHVWPGIRERVLAHTVRHAPDAWLRDCSDGFAAIMARPYRLRALGSAVHARGLRRAAERSGLRCNRGFAGIYDFRADFEMLFPRFLTHAGPEHLVICHPGRGRDGSDPIEAARSREALALSRLPVRRLAEKAGLEYAG